jgi:hypothetical protein
MLDHPSRSSSRSRSVSTKVPAPGIAPMLNVFNPATACMEFWKRSAFELGGEAAQSWLHFLGERWLKDLKFPQQVAGCKTADDLGVAISEYWGEAANDYSEQFTRIADLTWTATRLTFGGFGPFACDDGAASRGHGSLKPAGRA